MQIVEIVLIYSVNYRPVVVISQRQFTFTRYNIHIYIFFFYIYIVKQSKGQLRMEVESSLYVAELASVSSVKKSKEIRLHSKKVLLG